MIKCDKDGVPLLVQNLWYRSTDMLCCFVLFNSTQRHLIAVENAVNVDLLAEDLTRMQYLQVENWLNKFVIENWSRYSI